MTSLRQIEANRRNARLSTGPVTEGGKNRSRQNAIRHGLTAETVITAFEDASDYAAFELAITRDYDPQTAVERELVLRLASLLWRLRRTTAIESGLFNMQASQRPHFTEPELEPRGQNPDEDPSKSKRTEMQGTKVVHIGQDSDRGLPPFAKDPCAEFGLLTQSFVALSHLPTCPLDRLSRYEATLWRQAGQVIFTLQMLQAPGSWKRPLFRLR
ncbi:MULTISPECIES: hypothetical protein [unclassified Bradyrhizobium]|uniref:hypothetical protein n=1 Tax=unclassified Bradyrhizobium TaxID=2631580 RepID=UPI003394DA26